ncbi:MAG: TrkA family potassium uptake protein [Anaerolineae bacterium]|nr:TrkA family potassium uptake protein [Gloeobacterales cyanobacterium ES-bin-313]
MRIIVVGGGRYGSLLTHSLLYQGYQVSLIESNSGRAMELAAEFGRLVIEGNGVDRYTLDRAIRTGFFKKAADWIIPCTGDDLTNQICALTARHICSTIKICIRIKEVEHARYWNAVDRVIPTPICIPPETFTSAIILTLLSVGTSVDGNAN